MSSSKFGEQRFYTLYILNRRGTCIFYHAFQRNSQESIPDEAQFISGAVNAFNVLLREVVPSSSPFSAASVKNPPVHRATDLSTIGSTSIQHQFEARKDFALPSDAPQQAFYAVKTADYKMHVLQTITGYLFSLMTEPTFQALEGQRLLESIFCLFVDYVVKDPLYVHYDTIATIGPPSSSSDGGTRVVAEKTELKPREDNQPQKKSAKDAHEEAEAKHHDDHNEEEKEEAARKQTKLEKIKKEKELQSRLQPGNQPMVHSPSFISEVKRLLKQQYA